MREIGMTLLPGKFQRVEKRIENRTQDRENNYFSM
jgi:hypothetical protein